MHVLTRLAGVSSRTCRLPDPQTDAEAATSWSSLGKLSTILCIILLIRIVSVQVVTKWERRYNKEVRECI